MRTQLTRAALVSFFIAAASTSAWASDGSEMLQASHANMAMAAPAAYAKATPAKQARAAHRAPRGTYQSPQASVGSFGSGSSLVAEARRYLGTNPTGRSSLWCGAFMDKVLRELGFKGGGNLAKGYLHYGRRVSGPVVGSIAVMGRRGGGHVGVVSGVDANGNPIIVSGNTWGKGSGKPRVMEQVFPRSRIIAYVEPTR